jgi:hypothetical protein
MRNLTQTSKEVHAIANVKNVVCSCVNSASEGDTDTQKRRVYAVVQTLDNEDLLVGYNLRNRKVELSYKLREIIQVDEDKPIEVLSMEYIPDLAAVCFATRAGEIVLFDTTTKEVWGIIMLV